MTARSELAGLARWPPGGLLGLAGGWWRSRRAPVVRPAPVGVWELALDATVALRPGRGAVLSCRAGTFLVTQEGDPSDHVLEPGDRFAAASPGLVVAWALREGVLALEPPAP